MAGQKEQKPKSPKSPKAPKPRGLSKLSSGTAQAERPFYQTMTETRNPVMSAIWDTIESMTIYHREPADIKVRLGWYGFFGFFLRLAMIIVIIHQIFTANVYLEEEVPVAQFSAWSSDIDSMTDLADAQASGSLCNYNQSFDYKYGMDNVYDYTASHCARSTMANIAFKTPDAIQIVSYEQRREDTLIRRNGSSNCDLECRTLYPQWPSVSSYGTSKWRSVHVASRLHARMVGDNPDLRDAPNTHLLKPEVFGTDRCRCYSLQNVFILGVEATGVEFNHMYSAASFGFSGSSKETGTNDPISFLMVQGASRPFKVIEKGLTNKFSIAEALEELGTCMDCQPDENWPFWTNSLCDGTCEEPYQEKPTPRMAGMTLDIRTEFFNDKVVMPKEPAYDWIRENHEPPYAIHVLRMSQDWASRGSDLTVMHDDGNTTVMRDIYRYGVLVRITPAAGRVSRFNIQVVIDNLVNFTVLLGFPSAILTVVVFWLCGNQSYLFRRGKTHWYSTKGTYRNFMCQAACADRAFQSLDTDNSGILGRQEVFELFKSMALPQLRAQYPEKTEEWFDARLETLMEVIISKNYSAQDDEDADTETEGIALEDWIRNSTYSLGCDWDDIIDKIVNPSCDLDPAQKLFKMCCGGPTKDPKKMGEVPIKKPEGPFSTSIPMPRKKKDEVPETPAPPTNAWAEQAPAPADAGGLAAARDAVGGCRPEPISEQTSGAPTVESFSDNNN